MVLKEFYMPIVVLACLCVGFVLKKWLPTDDKWIPTIMLVLGAALGCVATGGVSLESLVCGGVSGLASTGMHQVFKQLIEDGGDYIEMHPEDERNAEG